MNSSSSGTRTSASRASIPSGARAAPAVIASFQQCCCLLSAARFTSQLVAPPRTMRDEFFFPGNLSPAGRRSSTRRLLAIAREENLQIFQPAVDAGPVSWPITRKVEGLKLHRTSRDARCRKGPNGAGSDQQPPCGNHIEIMARGCLPAAHPSAASPALLLLLLLRSPALLPSARRSERTMPHSF